MRDEAPARPRPSSLSPHPLILHAALFSVSALFSLNYIVSKVSMHAFAPLSFAWLRVTGAAIALNLVVPARGLSRRDSLLVAGFSVLAVVLNQTMFLTGLALTSAHIAAILITTIPVFALATALVMRVERATLAKVGGIALALAGALLVIGAEGVRGITDALAGALLITGNCVAYAVYLVVSKPAMTRLSPARVISRMFAIGAVLMFPIALPALMREEWRAIPRGAWIGLAVVIAGPTVAAYVINAWTLRHAESSLVAAYTYVQPVLTTVLAWLFLNERIRPVVALAAVLIFAGVALAGKRDVAQPIME
ncbi:MAG TPA: DMT family transporter [Thermoanaerobaculia bacterium]